jgi:hypothetical protein
MRPSSKRFISGSRLLEPFKGQVILRPVNLLEMEKLLRAKDWRSNKRKAALAYQLSVAA